jgi:phosphoribosylamine--glycine ligase
MNILIIGSGGREHAFAWKVRQSDQCDKLFVLPGNAGTAEIAENIDGSVTDFERIGRECIEKDIALVIVGPEVPLVEGIVDFFKTKAELQKILIIGPGKNGAQLEGSKDFSKAFMSRHNIPTAASRTFTKENFEEGVAYIHTQTLPVVLKADGLAAGKGVIIAENHNEAEEAFKDMLLNNKFGDAGARVVIEQFLQGIELSVFALVADDEYILLPEAKDYKRIGEGDTGLNTGGMGAISPVPFAGKAFLEKVEKRIVKPTIEGLQKEGIDYTGFIFFGLMNVNGDPYVIEYNARMGDPETEVVLPRIKNDFVALLVAAAKKELSQIKADLDERTATTVMLVAGGYPESYEKGKEISGLDKVTEVIPFHAGTALKQGKVITNGGRVIALTALGKDIKDALAKSNKAAETILWENKYFRKDIGFDLVGLDKNVVI